MERLLVAVEPAGVLLMSVEKEENYFRLFCQVDLDF